MLPSGLFTLYDCSDLDAHAEYHKLGRDCPCHPMLTRSFPTPAFPTYSNGIVRMAFDVWGDDSNDRSCWGVVAIDVVPEYYYEAELDYLALDVAIHAYCKPDVIDKLEYPYMAAVAVYDFCACDCSCHEADADDLNEHSNPDCDDDGEYCYASESISVEPCDDPETDYYHHARIKLEDI